MRAQQWLLLVVATLIPLTAHGSGPLGRKGALFDPDCYQWLVLIEKWEARGLAEGWYEFNYSPRGNAPWGERLHWTKPFGLLLYVPAKMGAWLGGASFRAALWRWGILVSPVLFAISVLLFLKAWGLLLPEREQVLATLLLLVAPGVLAACAGGRPDHHSLQLMIFAATQTALLVGVCQPLRLPGMARLAGICAGLGLWVGVEAWVLAATAAGFLGLLWIWRGKLWLDALSGFLNALAMTTLAALMVEHPPSEWAQRMPDSLSATTVGIAVLGAGLVMILKALPIHAKLAQRGRLAAALITGAAGLALGGACFPEFFAGPTSVIEPRALALWMRSVSEAEPLAANLYERWPLALAFIAAPLIPLLYLVAKGRAALPDARLAMGWTWVALATLVYTALALWGGLRWAGYAQAACLPAWTLVLMRITQKLGRWQMLAALCLGVLPLLPGIISERTGSDAAGTAARSVQVPSHTALSFVKTRKRAQLPLAELGQFLDTLPAARGKPPIVLAFINHGPELLYRSHVFVVSTPYHRNGAAIVDEWEFFTDASPVGEKARVIATGRRIDYVLIFPGCAEERAYYSRAGGESLHARLGAGNFPQWLEPVPLPSDLGRHAAIFKCVAIAAAP